MTVTSTASNGVESTLTSSDAAFLVDFVGSRIGVQLIGKEYLMESRLTPVCRDLGFGTVDELVAKVRGGDRVAQAKVLDSMTTNETSFFRDSHPFESLARDVLPAILESTHGRLHVWNAASSSGQESFTFGITMHEHFPQHATRAKLKILSTDVSSEMIERTKAAEYSKFEVNRGLPSDQAMKYFNQAGRKWVAKPLLTDLVEARVLNLLDPFPPMPTADVVLLRNVLCYFKPDVKERILQRIRSTVIASHGVLVLGASESLMGLNVPFEARRVGQSTFHFPI